MKRLLSIVIFAVAAIAVASCQKPEEKAEQATAKAKLESAQVKEAIYTYIQENTGSEGAFAVEDKIESRTRQLAFGYIHDSVHETDDGRYYACVDFTEAPNNTLDLDIYVKADASGAPQVSEVVIHKVNGVSQQ